MTGKTERLRLYLAAPLFNEMEREFNKTLAIKLTQYFEVFLPQEDGGLMTDMIKSGLSSQIAGLSVFQADITAMKRCDVLLIVLDGRTVDEGAAFELGYIFGMGKPCYGLQTDTRRLLPTGNNPMLQGSLITVFLSTSELLQWADDLHIAGVRYTSKSKHLYEKQAV